MILVLALWISAPALAAPATESPDPAPVVRTLEAPPGLDVQLTGGDKLPGDPASAVPEPSAFLAFATGALLVGLTTRRRAAAR